MSGLHDVPGLPDAAAENHAEDHPEDLQTRQHDRRSKQTKPRMKLVLTRVSVTSNVWGGNIKNIT